MKKRLDHQRRMVYERLITEPKVMAGEQYRVFDDAGEDEQGESQRIKDMLAKTSTI